MIAFAWVICMLITALTILINVCFIALYKTSTFSTSKIVSTHPSQVCILAIASRVFQMAQGFEGTMKETA
jgi:uncharacterized membrane protein